MPWQCSNSHGNLAVAMAILAVAMAIRQLQGEKWFISQMFAVIGFVKLSLCQYKMQLANNTNKEQLRMPFAMATSQIAMAIAKLPLN